MYKELKTVCPHCQHEARRRVNLDTCGVGWNLQPVRCLKCTKGYTIAFEVEKEAGKKVLNARRVKGYYQMEVFQPVVKPRRVLTTDCYTRRVYKGEVLAVGCEVQVGCYRGRVAEVRLCQPEGTLLLAAEWDHHDQQMECIYYTGQGRRRTSVAEDAVIIVGRKAEEGGGDE